MLTDFFLIFRTHKPIAIVPIAPIVEPDPEIEAAAAMYYEGNDAYNEEEGEY